MRKLLITGGAGFIGSHVVRHLVNRYDNYQIVNLDALTYAGNLENLTDVEKAPNYTFIKGSITDVNLVDTLFQTYNFDGVIHLAAESHVDRSITDPLCFFDTNVKGTLILLEACRKFWDKDVGGRRFYHISTDEVFGSLTEGFFTEKTPYDPSSPYSASKASSDHFVRAYRKTYGIPYVISNCSNNYGPNQFPEKLIPLCIYNILHQKALPIYGDGLFTRDWLYVVDHARAIDLIFHEGTTGETYAVGGCNEWTNIDLVKELCRQMDVALKRPEGSSEQLIRFVEDRPGHDLRYAIDAAKVNKELGWKPSVTFEEGLTHTIQWYLQNQDWMVGVTSGSYQRYYEQQYKEALKKEDKSIR